MSRRLGQHFLSDKSAAKAIVASAGITSRDAVLEIGPGRGALTGMIADAAGDVAAVELDAELCCLLEKKFAQRKNLRIIRGNFLEVDFDRVFPGWEGPAAGKVKVIGNIPYYITSPILEKLFNWSGSLDSVVMTVQKEVAERMCSGPGSKRYGALSVFVGSNAEAKIIMHIGRESFSPPPEVDSAAVRMVMTGSNPFSGDDKKLFSRFVKSMFAQKRKMVHNALQRAAPLEKLRAAAVLKEAGIEPSHRPEQLSAGDYILLFNKMREMKSEN